MRARVETFAVTLAGTDVRHDPDDSIIYMYAVQVYVYTCGYYIYTRRI